MPRYRLLVEYDGRPYHGFQAQADQPSVQSSIERAILGFCGESLRLHAAGRTDSGVHAIGQVIHIDLEKDWDAAVVRGRSRARPAPTPRSMRFGETSGYGCPPSPTMNSTIMRGSPSSASACLQRRLVRRKRALRSGG